MSYDLAQTRRRLPLYYLAVPGAAALAHLVPQWSLLTDLSGWYLLPAWIALAHVLCGVSYVITAGKLQRFWGLLRSSVHVYGRLGSGLHLQAAFLVALAEEALFRYALLGGLARWTQSPLLGLGVSTLVFGLAHLPGHLRVARRGWAPVRRVLDLTLFGLVLGVLVLATDSFWPALIVHGGRNYILRCLLVSKREYARYHADKLADKLADGLADELAESAPGERDGKLRDGARRS